MVWTEISHHLFDRLRLNFVKIFMVPRECIPLTLTDWHHQVKILVCPTLWFMNMLINQSVEQSKMFLYPLQSLRVANMSGDSCVFMLGGLNVNEFGFEWV